MDSFIHFDAVSKSFGAMKVVDGLDFHVGRGEFVSLLGPSGSGKTTLLMMLAGFEAPTSGAIHVDGVRVERLPPYKRNMGVVFQNYALFPHMTIAENVSFPLKMRGMSRAERDGRVTRALDLVRLGHLKARRPSQLSGGQQQRIALARSLVYEPKVVLMDEPLSALDKQLREHMQLEIRELHRKLGLTVIFVTHDQGEALTMSDRIAVMNDGHIEHLGTPRQIYEYPATKFVAGFIGTSNLLTGTVAGIEGGRAIITSGPGERIVVPLQANGVRPGDVIELSVRPEKIDMSLSVPASSDRCVVRGTVTEVVYLGTSTNYNVATSTGAEIVVFDQNASNAEDIAARGDSVFLSWNPQHSYPIGTR